MGAVQTSDETGEYDYSNSKLVNQVKVLNIVLLKQLVTGHLRIDLLVSKELSQCLVIYLQ
jgi:hypothetical protein